MGQTVAHYNSLNSESPWEWQRELEGHTLPWYNATPNHAAIVLPPSTLPLIGDEHGCVEVSEDVLGMVGNQALPFLPKCGYAFLRGVFPPELMGRIAQLHAPTPAQGINIFNENGLSRTAPVDASVRIMDPQENDQSALHDAAGLLANLYRCDLRPENPVFNVVCFIAVKQGTTRNQWWHRDVNKIFSVPPLKNISLPCFPC